MIQLIGLEQLNVHISPQPSLSSQYKASTAYHDMAGYDSRYSTGNEKLKKEEKSIEAMSIRPIYK